MPKLLINSNMPFKVDLGRTCLSRSTVISFVRCV